MKQKIMIVVAVMALGILPVSASAATYGYINKAGALSFVEAPHATAALKNPNIHANSGVILIKAGNKFGLTVTPTVAPVATLQATTTAATSTMKLATSPLSVASSTVMVVGTSTSVVGTSTATTTATSTVR